MAEYRIKGVKIVSRDGKVLADMELSKNVTVTGTFEPMNKFKQGPDASSFDDDYLRDAVMFERHAEAELRLIEQCRSEVGKMEHRRYASQLMAIAKRLRALAEKESANG